MDNDYQNRLVNLEKVHCVGGEMFDQLVSVTDLKAGLRVLDAGSAYGAVTQAILQRNPPKDLTYHLLELSATQLGIAKSKLAELLSAEQMESKTAFFNESILAPSAPEGYYDRIIGKLLWHEIAHANQPELARVMHRLLADEGKLVLWQITLEDEMGDFYRAIVREKDRLAGFHSLVTQRYFPNESELLAQLKDVGFQNITCNQALPYHFDSATRLATDFKQDQTKLAQWHEFIRKEASKLSPRGLEQIQYVDATTHLEMRFSWGLYVAQK
ncbi:MAG: class I SAM-dependent methyltransferase [Bacteroidota bacterium]